MIASRVSFRRFFLVSTYFPGCNAATVALSNPTNKGLRISSADGTFALGFARIGTATQLDFVFTCNFGCGLDAQKIIINYHNFHTITSTAWEKETVNYAIGTPAEVLTRMQQIYSDTGGDCLN